jgi:riboflavin kinase/FMN adenylyltransferase
MASHVVDWNARPPDSCRGGAATIGNFDGAHRGHAALVAEAARLGRQVGGPAVALTFDPHPAALLRPGQAPPLLTTAEDRAAVLQHLGADEVLTLRATPALLELEAADFFDRVLRDGLGVRAMVEGSNFGFGHNRQGDVDLLGRLCLEAGVLLSVAPPVLVEGSEVSSSRIREALRDGDVALAARLLGRCYRLRGVVGVGQRRGRTLGFPTANLTGVETVVPGDGVYAVRVVDEAGRVWPGATNVGPNPTFAEQQRKIEVHLIGFAGELVGRGLAVDFVGRLRDTRPFAGPAELVAQLRRDVEEARACVEERGA